MGEEMTVQEFRGGMLYHYTSENGITGIFHDNKLIFHLTKINSLNDKSEGKDIFETLDFVCKEMKKAKEISDEFYNKVMSLYHDDVTKAANNSCQSKAAVVYRRKKLISSDCETFVMSFSRKSDCLPMWNYYTTAGCQGYSIKFYQPALNQALQNISPDFQVSFQEVIYHPNTKNEKIKKVLQEGMEKNSTDPIIEVINSHQYLFKHQAFNYEAEVRLVVTIKKDTLQDSKSLKFRTRNGMIVPYLELTIDRNLDDIVRGVSIGPLSNDTVVEENLKMYLHHKGFDKASNSITTTNIPIRF